MAGGANALVECRKNCNDGEEGGRSGGGGGQANKRWKSGCVAPPFSRQRGKRGCQTQAEGETTDTDGEKMSEKRQFCDRNISPHPDVSELRFVDSARHTSVDILNV